MTDLVRLPKGYQHHLRGADRHGVAVTRCGCEIVAGSHSVADLDPTRRCARCWRGRPTNRRTGDPQ